MAQLEVRTNFCTFEPIEIRSGLRPGCTCGWTANISYVSRAEAEATWRDYHKPTKAAEHDSKQDGIFVMLLAPEKVDPDRPRVDPPATWNHTPPPRSNPAIRRGDEGMAWQR